MAERDELATANGARSYLERQGLEVPREEPSSGQLERLRVVRDLAHDILETPEADWHASLAEAASHHVFRFDAAGSLVPAAPGWDGFTASFVPALFELERQRSALRHCGNGTCQWLFVDRSKNKSRVWCDMGTCGSRAKMTRYRTRQRASSTGAHEAQHVA